MVILIPEISLMIATGALIITLISGCFGWRLKKKLQRRLDDLQKEVRTNNAAMYGLARHLRKSSNNQPEGKQEDLNLALSKAHGLIDAGIDTHQLADELGLSQSEAEVIRYLNPGRHSEKV